MNLCSIEPKISDFIADHRLGRLASQLNQGRKEIRDSEVYLVRNAISTWGIGVPANKRL